MQRQSAATLSPKPPVDAALLVNNLASPVLALDPDNALEAANPAAEQLLGASWSVLEGRRIEALLAPHSPLLALIEQVRASAASISDYGLELALARGRTVTLDAHLSPVAERPGHVIIVLHPCSMARRLDQQLAHRGATRSIAALARTLAHEVKNPLSGIRGAAQLLEPYVEEAEDKALVHLICEEADRICALVDRMDVFSEGRPLDASTFNIHQVLEHVRRIAENGFGRHVRFVELYDPSLPDVEGDRDRLIQAFLNLVKNAAEAAPESGGQITLVTHYQHGLRVSQGNSQERLELPITVEVRDNGSGVRPDMVDHLFEPFVSSKPKGGGLGLSLVAKIVGDHGGVVAYARGEPGAIFRVRLPAARQDGRPEAEA